jgi:hypothetical protein
MVKLQHRFSQNENEILKMKINVYPIKRQTPHIYWIIISLNSGTEFELFK